jgi:para-nitrobenzyl esterase
MQRRLDPVLLVRSSIGRGAAQLLKRRTAVGSASGTPHVAEHEYAISRGLHMKYYLIAGVLSAVVLAAAPAQTNSQARKATPAKVTIDSGVLVGESIDGVNVFRGVPYAKPPIGELRWKTPQKPDKWPGERSAVAFEPPCAQPTNIDGKTANGGGVAGVTSEDCLYLNVYAPANASKAPVVVWLYGGAFYLGAGHLGSYNGTSNARNGVITVAFNYRLGSLGTFAHPALTKEAGTTGKTGSFALMDAVAALEWVKRNATAFGGDPNNVTVAGQSAGAVMVLDLLSIPAAKGLYHKAVIQSGAMMLGTAPKLADAEKRGADAATALGLPGAQATVAQLRAISAQTLVANPATQSGFSLPLGLSTSALNPSLHLGAPIDGRFKTTSTVDALNAGTEIDVPVMVGSNSGEAGFGGARTVAKLAGASGAGAWLYQFAYVPAFRKAEWKSGAIHSAELMFTFDSIDTASWSQSASGKADDADHTFAKTVNSCWIAFYKMDPKAKSLTCADGLVWPAYTEATDQAMQFKDKAQVVKSKAIPDGPTPPASGGS